MTSRRQRERGASAVEFALVLPFLLLLIGGIVDFGRFFYTQNIVVNAAREGARMLALGYPVTAASPPSAEDRIEQAMFGLDTSSGAYTPTYVACPATPSATDTAQVTIVYNNFEFIFLEPISGLLTVQPNGSARMRCGG